RPTLPEVPITPVMSPNAIYTRASLDIRGRRPSLDELDRLGQDESQLEPMLDALLQDEHFGVAVRDWFSRATRSRTGGYEYFPHILPEGTPGYSHALGEEMLKIIEHVAVTDRPFTEILTADYTFVHEHLMGIYPVTGYDMSVGGWQKVQYGDDRPAGGILVTNGFMRRYLTNDTNKNRGRFNAASRIFLCDNYLERPVDFPRDIDLTDEVGIQNAIDTNPACTTCHSSLDPGAGAMYGIAELPGRNPYGYYANTTYDDFEPFETDRGAGGTELFDVFPQAEPAYFGQRARNLGDLGQAMAQDPRFARCMTQRTYEALIDRPATLDDFDAISKHNATFIASGMTYRALVRSILSDPVYRGGNDKARPGTTTKVMAPEVLGDAIGAFTGFEMRAVLGDFGCDEFFEEESFELEECHALAERYTSEQWREDCLDPASFFAEEDDEECIAVFAGEAFTYDLMRDDEVGLRVVGGGLAATSGDYPSMTFNAPRILVQNRLAEAAAAYLVHENRDLLETMLDRQEVMEAPQRADLERLTRLFFSQPADPETVEAYLGLVQELEAVTDDDLEQLWALVLSALLRDPLFVNY
ncbi:MAG: DUF1592 domain-containing protein, partial [Myxococcota bacterium]